MDLNNLSKEAHFSVNGSYGPIVADVQLSPVLTYSSSVKLKEVMAEQLVALRKQFNGFIANELKAWFDNKASQGLITSKAPLVKEGDKVMLLEHFVADTKVSQTVYNNGVIRVTIALPTAIVNKSDNPDVALAEAFLGLRKKIAQAFKEGCDEYGVGTDDVEKKVTLECTFLTAAELGFDTELEV